jgi:hypothetical protein
MYLLGRYADDLMSRGEAVPPWAWVNTLAHAAPDHLVALSHNPGQPSLRPELWAWQRTVSFLAAEILETASRQATSVAEIQSLVVVPIELAAMPHTFGPSTVLRIVLGALHDTPIPETDDRPGYRS